MLIKKDKWGRGGLQEARHCLPADCGKVPGGWHPVAEVELRKLAAALSRHTGQEEEEALRHLWGRLGTLMQSSNAAILGNRVPTHPAALISGAF